MGGPLHEARQMMGCLDETGNFEYGQVFVQYSKPENISSYLFEGEIVVAENPCLYPGVVRVLKDVDVEALHHMVDCVVFPTRSDLIMMNALKVIWMETPCLGQLGYMLGKLGQHMGGPLQDARQMMGCLDETGNLEYGQVFVQYSKPENISSYLVEGEIVVAENPCLYPGDVRVLKDVDVEALHHMVDCVVFPKKKKGSDLDLDGDVYFVCWYSDLIPPIKETKHLDYNSAISVQLDHDVTNEEIMDHFTNFITKDNLGLISTVHTIFADKEPKMAFNESCVDLANKFSIVVDSPKTGISVGMYILIWLVQIKMRDTDVSLAGG
ncbi:hypothetical protein RD792_008558 [Penstemon davidsonii]|uniref:RNA-dependent RNA polymerase n=1 Tax=Penstemon davidsonii TaxID=160366 RepID=A0ABR0D9K4_9LAMI|nr:hypothetical protein RD792_008558 [Penstemon davidsonii]